MADDYSADIDTTGTLSVGGSTTGVFETANDSDWFKISLSGVATYLFTVTGGPGSGAVSNFGNLEIMVYNALANYGVGAATYIGSAGAVGQYVAPTGGTYFVSVRGAYPGSYTLKAATPAADDYRASSQTTGRLEQGVPLAGAFERSDDIDWLKFHGEAGQVIGFIGTGTLSGTSSSSSQVVYGANGIYLGSVGEQTPFIAATSGDYYLALSANGRIGAYTQTMQLVSDDYSSDDSRPGKLSPGKRLVGSTDYAGDVDRYQISLEQGSIYTFTLKLQDTSGTQRPALAVFLPSGDDNSSYDLGGSTVAADGTITLRYLAGTSGVHGLNVTGYKVQDYVLSASVGELDDHGNTQATATALVMNVTAGGKLQSTNDVDMFKVDLKAGVTYQFDLSTDNTAQSGAAINSQLRDSAGQSLLNYSYNGSGRYTYTADKDGSYYLSQSSINAVLSSTNFNLTASAAQDDYSANASGAGRVSIGSFSTGVIDNTSDRDWFAVALEADKYYWFRLDGANEGGGTLGSYTSVIFKLLDGSGKVLLNSASLAHGTGVTLPFTAPTQGIYYLEVGSTASTGSYTVQAQPGKLDDYGNDTQHATSLAPDTLIKGEIEVGNDKDVFKLCVVAGTTYSVELAPQASNTYMSSLNISGPGSLNVRSVSSSEGKLVKLFEATQSGDYYVTVGGASGYNWSGSYALVARSMGIDDFSADSKTTAVLTPGAPVRGAIDVADDHDWIKVHLEAGRTYVFDMKGSKSGGGTLDTSGSSSTGMVLLNSNGNRLAYTSLPAAGVGADPRLTYVASITGDYYLDAHGSGSSTGSYTVEMVQTNLDATGPKLLSSSIAAGATDVGTRPKFTLAFDETVMLGRGVTLTDGYGALVLGMNGALQAGVAGNTLTVDPRTNLMPGMTYTVNLLKGSIVDLSGNSSSESQSFSFTVTKPVSSGTAGDDYLIGSGIGLTLDGGAGNDTVYYAGGRSMFTIARSSDGTATVQNYRASGTSGTSGDKLSGVERLLFGDGSAVALDTEGVGGQAYRLYKSAFNRTPDNDGLGYWIATLDKGLSLREAASSFIASAEFTRAYGSAPSDADFVKLLYQNVLQRTPDTAGSNYWVGNLQAGQSRADLLVYFSEGTENHDTVAKLIGNGFSYTPYGG